MKQRVAVIHPQIIKGGGSEVFTMQMVEAIQNDYDVSIISSGSFTIKDLNEFFGSNIYSQRVKLRLVPIPILFSKFFGALRAYKLTKFVRRLNEEFDVMISAYNIMNFGKKKGIQFIADFSFEDALRRSFNYENTGYRDALYKDSFIRRLYIFLSKALAGLLNENWKGNLTVSNSLWTSKIMENFYGIKSAVIYPPIIGNFDDIPWDRRNNGFIYLGRISPEKEIEKIINILKIVRKNNKNIHLNIVGRNDNNNYYEKIKKLCTENKEWCFLKGQMNSKDKRDFIASHKYGIFARKYEPFGIAIGEMVKAGCIVFVPNGGGQVEIVGTEKLVYIDKEDCARKIEAILGDRDMQEEVRNYLKAGIKKFSVEKFNSDIIKIISDFLKNNERA